MSEEMRDGNGQPITEQGQPQASAAAQPANGEQQAAAPTSGEAIQAAPGPEHWNDPEPITKEELERTRAELASMLEEIEKTKRETQSFADRGIALMKKELSAKIKTVDDFMGDPEIAAYLGDDYEHVKRRKKAETVADYFSNVPEAPVEAPPAPQQQNPIQHPEVQRAIRELGVTPQDPEFIDPSWTSGPAEYRTLMERAAAQKRQRLAAHQPTNQPPPPVPPERKPAQVSMGTGEAPRPMDPSKAMAAYRKAKERGDHKEAQRLDAIIQAAIRG